MKWTTQMTIGSKFREIGERIGLLGRIYIVLTLCSFLFFVMLGLGGIFQSKVNQSPVSSMKGFAAMVSSQFFADMIGMELPFLSSGNSNASTTAISPMSISNFLFQSITNVNPKDPKSLLASSVPLMGSDSAILLKSSIGTDTAAAPEDYQSNNGSASGEMNQDGQVPDDGQEVVEPDQEDPTPTEPVKEPSVNKPDNPVRTKLSTGNKKVVYIYHSHNRESYFPALKKGAKYAEDAKINVTLLGKRLADKLQAQGIGAQSSKTDYASSVKNYNWNFSYKYSLKTVQTAFTSNPDIKYLFDIHRDSSGRKKTTANIKGTNYAQVYFIIGHGNPNWKKNEQFASKLQESLEVKYPGISRGIWGKSSSTGNGEYNQHISPNSILIEIGGIENTLEECYRTVDVLAKMISEVYWDAEKVNAKQDVAMNSTVDQMKKG